MGIGVLVLGSSGSGKSSSLRRFKREEIGIFNVASKPLPFRNKNNLISVNKATYDMIKSGIKSGNRKSWVIDDAQYLMAFESFARAKESNYSKFTDMAKNYEELLRFIQEDTPADNIVYIFQHIDKDENGNIKAKSLGKMLDQQLCIEGLFTIVLLAQTDGKSYRFLTQTDGTNPCKTPFECDDDGNIVDRMFNDAEIPNDLKLVDDTIREYYGLNVNTKENKKNNKE